MIYRIAIWIKTNIPFLWNLFEYANGFAFGIFFHRSFIKAIERVLLSHGDFNEYSLRLIKFDELSKVSELCLSIEESSKRFFEPHRFDKFTLERLFHNPSFFMFGVFQNHELAGYFFLRCFINRKCFVGRFLKDGNRNVGLGNRMNEILYPVAWVNKFRVFATFSLDNQLVVQSHKNNKSKKSLVNLNDNYVLVEFVKSNKQI